MFFVLEVSSVSQTNAHSISYINTPIIILTMNTFLIYWFIQVISYYFLRHIIIAPFCSPIVTICQTLRISTGDTAMNRVEMVSVIQRPYFLNVLNTKVHNRCCYPICTTNSLWGTLTVTLAFKHTCCDTMVTAQV